jgi:hypothetical protein
MRRWSGAPSLIRDVSSQVTPAQVQTLADRLCAVLMAHAAHGLATSSLEGMGEITLRDGLIVAAAAAAADSKQAWILRREILPEGWMDSSVDMMIYRIGQQNAERLVGGVELKWWRHDDKGNASNRRRDLVKDLIRAAALYQNAEEFSFVALLSTDVSWTSTTETTAADVDAMKLLVADDSRNWNMAALSASPAVRGAIRALKSRVPIPNIFHSKLLSKLELRFASGKSAFARVWSLKKPQKTHVLSEEELNEILAGES